MTEMLPNNNAREEWMNGQWGSGEVVNLFRDLFRLQVESGLYGVWAGQVRKYGKELMGQPYNEASGRQVLSDLRAELPLALQLGEDIDEEGMVGSDYWLIKVNPATGEVFGSARTAAITVTVDGELMPACGIEEEAYSERQRELMLRQLQEQQLYGLVLKPGI